MLCPPIPRAAALAAGLAGLLASACRSESVSPSEPPNVAVRPLVEATLEPGRTDTPPPPIDREAEAIRAIGEGDYEGARGILAELLLTQYLGEARTLLDAESPEDALLWVDRATELAPKNAAVRLLDARGRLMLAEKALDEGGSAVFVEGAIQDALEAYLRAGSSPEAAFGASRSAWLAGRSDEALRFARAGMAALESPADAAEDQLRILAEAAFGAYVALQRTEEPDPDRVKSLFAETEEALSRLMGRVADDPWIWTTLAHLNMWEGRFADARSTLERGLDRIPDDPGMLERLAEASFREGPEEGAWERQLQTLLAFQERHPDVAGGHWHVARARFEGALARLEAGERTPEAFREAEASFRRCRELRPDFAEACKGYEAMCRNGLGWCLHGEGDLEGAKEAFLSMEELFEGGLDWQLEGRLLSGVVGLEFVADGYRGREDWLAAGEVHDLLRNHRSGEPKFANNAGYFFREAALELELLGRRLCQAAAGEITAEGALAQLREQAGIDASIQGTAAEVEALRRSASELLARARGVMERSRDAYMDAAEAAPEDVRIVNDAALVLVYYLHEDLDLAEELLLRCVEMGTQQLEDEALGEDARWELQNAWGDAHQNLGVLYFNHRDDPETARTWFETCVEIGPDPRPNVTEFWLPLLAGEREAAEHEDLFAPGLWARPCE